MFYLISLTAYLLFFAFLTWTRFHWGLTLFFALLPTYLIRFHFGPIPTTLLEMMLWIIFIIWLIKYKSLITNHLSLIIHRHLSLFIAILLFLTAATVSVFTSVNLRAAAGEWKAFYVEPIIIFFILITSYQLPVTKNFTNKIIFALVLSGFVTSLLAIYQHFTGWLVPYDFWQNRNTFRVTAWYGFPNAVGLFLAPLVPLAIYLLKQKTNISCLLSLIFIPLAIIAIIFSKGAGPLVGLTAGIGFLLLMHKKTRWSAVVIGFISLLSIFSLSSLSSIRQELSLQNRSGQIRLSIWNETRQFLKDNPISGAGLASYSDKIKPYHTTVNGEGIEIFHHPHNIFLAMYVNLGLLGLISFILIIYCYFKILISNLQFSILQFNNLAIYLGSSMLIILIMGLVDSPYIKNDLAIIFWLLPALLIINDGRNKSLQK